MKKILTLLFINIALLALAQPSATYYNGTAGLTGAALKTKLFQIISTGTTDNGYSALWTGYATTDRDYFYENDGTILDIYSENAAGTDPYSYTYATNQCSGSTPTAEGGCYNREHIVPQSMFNSASPMVSDIHFIRPTDSKVNGWRGDFPFGVVATASITTLNGSKIGSSGTTGYSGSVFEPANAFKGDVARMVFYFVTRYESQLAGFGSSTMLSGSAFPGLTNWELQQLLAWNNNDPVSPAEIARNNASYTFQGNRNPFIDNPQWANDIWGTPDTTAPTAPTALTSTGTTSNTVSLSWTAATDNVGVAAYDIYVNGVYSTTVTGTTCTISGLSASTTYSFYVIAKDMAGNASPQSNTVSATTTTGPSGGSCGTENFETIPTATSSSYSTRTWTNNNITWTATDARTDQTINNKAITVRNGNLTSSSITGGISSITVTTQLKFAGSSSNLNLEINGVNVGAIPYSATTTTTTISNLNVTGNVVIKLIQPTTDNRVAIDDISWTCYTLGTSETKFSNTVSIYPNPVTNGEIFVKGKDLNNIKSATIYTLEGRKVLTIQNPFKNGNKISTGKLPNGMYILNAGNISEKFIIKNN